MTEDYIYLVRTREFANQNEPTYKIGKTTRNVHTRINEYTLDTEVILLVSVNDCTQMERNIIKIFDSIFVKRKDLGLEYYTGDVVIMRNIIMSLVQIDEYKKIASMQKSTVENNLKLRQEKIINDRKQYREGSLVSQLFEVPAENKNTSYTIIEEHKINNSLDEIDNILDNDNIPIIPLNQYSQSVISNNINNVVIHNVNVTDDSMSNNTAKTRYANIVNTAKHDINIFVDYIKYNKPSWYKEDEPVKINDLYKHFVVITRSKISCSVFSKSIKGILFSKSILCTIDGVNARRVVLWDISAL